MMLYIFIKNDSGDCKMIGAEASVPESLQAVMKPYSEAGYTLAESEEYMAQVINGAKAGMVPDPSLGTSQSAEEVAAAEDVAASESTGEAPAETPAT